MPPRPERTGPKADTGKHRRVDSLHPGRRGPSGADHRSLCCGSLAPAGCNIQWQALDVAAIVQKVVDALHDSISEKNAEITVNPLPVAWGDPTAVEQIFANLVANAVRYLDPERPGRIEVGSVARHEDGEPRRASACIM